MKKYFAFGAVLAILLPSLAFASFDTDLHYGSTGQDVSALQEFLTQQSVYKGPTSGNFFSLTLAGVKAFQRAEGIKPVSGYVGPVTRGVINKIIAGQVSTSEGNATTTQTPVDLSQQPALSSGLPQSINLPNGAVVKINTDGSIASYTPAPSAPQPSTVGAQTIPTPFAPSPSASKVQVASTTTPSPTNAPTHTPIVGAQPIGLQTQASSTLTVSIPSSDGQVVPPGNNIALGKIQFSAGGGDVSLSAIPLHLTVGGGSVSDLSGCQLFYAAMPLNSAVSPVNGQNVFKLTQSLTVLKGTTVTLTPTCNVNNDIIDGTTFAWGIDATDSWSPTDNTSKGVVAKNIISSAGQVITMSVNGSITISVDVSTPPYSISAGGATGVTMGVYTFRPKNEAINLAQIGLTLASGVTGDLSKLYIYNGPTLLGIANFNNGAATTISTLTTSLTLPVNTDTQLTIKTDIGNIGSGQLGKEGDLVKVDLLNAQGIGAYTGAMISANGSAGISSVRIFKSYPAVLLDALPSSSGFTNNVPLARFEVTANPAGPVNINEINFDIAPTSGVTFGHLNVVVYNNAAYQPLPNGSSVSTGVVNISENLQPIGGVLTYANSITIPAGRTYYFQLQGNFSSSPTGLGSVTTKLQGDSSFSGMNTASEVSGNFVWSPNMNGTSGVNDADWANGYQISGLPTTGLNQTRTY